MFVLLKIINIDVHTVNIIKGVLRLSVSLKLDIETIGLISDITMIGIIVDRIQIVAGQDEHIIVKRDRGIR